MLQAVLSQAWMIIYFCCLGQLIYFLLERRTRQQLLVNPTNVTAAVLLLWFYPKIPSLADNPWINQTSLEYFLIFWLLCQSSLLLGMRTNSHSFVVQNMVDRPFSLSGSKRDRNVWMTFASFLSVLGAFAFYRYSSLPDEVLYMTQQTGVVTILLFVSTFLSMGMFIALAMCYEKKSVVLLAILVIGFALYAERIVVHGKRTEAFELLFMFAAAHNLIKRSSLSKIYIAAAVVLLVLLNATVSDYRGVMKKSERDVSSLSSIDVKESLKRSFTKADHDIVTAVVAVGAYTRHPDVLKFGSDYYNSLVIRYVPGQLVGRQLKRSMLIVNEDPSYIFNGYRKPIGTTTFIAGEVFSNFSWLGFPLFYFYGWFLVRIYERAKLKSLESVVLYMYFGAQIPVVLIFGFSQLVASLILWLPIFLIMRLFLRSRLNKPRIRYEIAATPTP